MLTLYFADPLALLIENGEVDAEQESEIKGLKVKLSSNDLLTSLTLTKVDYESGGIGFATAYLEIDGFKAAEDFATKKFVS